MPQPQSPSLLFRAIALSALAAAALPRAHADIITNGSFESGLLDPWSPDGSFDTAGAEVLEGGRLDNFALHLDAGEFEDQYHIFQTVAPTPVEDILSATLWTMTPSPRWGMPAIMRFHYEDGSTSDQLVPLTLDWTQSDGTAALVAGQVLTGFEIVWNGVGDEGPGSELFIDDIEIQTVPAPAAILVLGLAFAGRRKRETSPVTSR